MAVALWTVELHAAEVAKSTKEEGIGFPKSTKEEGIGGAL